MGRGVSQIGERMAVSVWPISGVGFVSFGRSENAAGDLLF